MVNKTLDNKTIECLCLGTIGLIVAPWKFDVLKTSIFSLEASLLGQIFVLRTSNFRGDQLSADSSSTETLYCLNRKNGTGFLFHKDHYVNSVYFCDVITK